MDRAIQLDMDKQAWPVLNNSLICIRTASKSLNIKFINNNKLIEWREWVTNFLSKDFSWERLKFMAKRIEKNNSNKSVTLMADSFLESIDSNLLHIFAFCFIKSCVTILLLSYLLSSLNLIIKHFYD